MRANSRPKPNSGLKLRRFGGRPARLAQQRNLLAHQARRRQAEHEERDVQHPERRLAHRFLKRQAERFLRGAVLDRRGVAGGRLAQAKRDDRPADEQDQRGQHKQRVPPAVGRDHRADHEHRQQRAAEPDSGIRAAEREAELAIEPRSYRLQITERPKADRRDRHDGPEQVVHEQIRGREVQRRKACGEQRDRREHDAARPEPVDQYALQRRHRDDHVSHDRERERRLHARPAEFLLDRRDVETDREHGDHARPEREPDRRAQSRREFRSVVASEDGLLSSMLVASPRALEIFLVARGHLASYGSAKTKSWLPLPGCSSGVRRANPNARPEPPVLTATYCLPPTE